MVYNNIFRIVRDTNIVDKNLGYLKNLIELYPLKQK
jgi:hypothetical protein